MLEYIELILFYSPLGILGLFRWLVWLIKKMAAIKYKPEKSSYNASVSVVTAVYNENPDIFKQALNSWKNNNPDEIIAVIDASDKSSIEIFKNFSKKFRNSVLKITPVPGKRPALAEGIKLAKNEISALVDSDTIWELGIMPKFLAPFVDPMVGGVATRQEVMETDSIARKLFDIHLSDRYFNEYPFLAATGNALTCLSGRTAVYRTVALLKVVDEMKNEKFMGRQSISGEDKTLTRLVQSKGWKTKYQMNAVVKTPGEPGLVNFFKQQMRWSRNSRRSDAISLFSKWIWQREKILALYMIDRFLQPFFLLFGPIYFVFSLYSGHWAIALLLLAWWFVSRAMKIFEHFKNKPSHISVLPAYILATYFMVALKIYALLTMRKQGWITRWDKKRFSRQKFQPAIGVLGTFFIISAFGGFVLEYKNFLADGIQNEGYLYATASNISQEKKEEIYQNIENRSFAFYSARNGETLLELSRKYNAPVAELLKANPFIASSLTQLVEGEQITFPVNALKNTFKKDQLLARPFSEVFFNRSENTIILRGKGTVATIPYIFQALSSEEKNPLLDLGSKEWLLSSNILILDGPVLLIDGQDVSLLKLKSDAHSYSWIESDRSGIAIFDTKITSFDSSLSGPDTNDQDGRSYISANHSGRMDIVNSEISYLGYKVVPASGGIFGLSWRISPGSFNQNLITGNIINSNIHHNYFGIYTFGATAMTIIDNKVHNNINYGIDPHDDSNNLLIENNWAFENGNHGIILSINCENNIISKNYSYNNRLHGIMLDNKSNFNVVKDNILEGNEDGIVMNNSSNNIIENNNVSRNRKSGIRANNESSRNHIVSNYVSENNNGLFIYGNANGNFLLSNHLENNKVGLYFKNSFDNFLMDTFNSGNLLNISLKDGAKAYYYEQTQSN